MLNKGTYFWEFIDKIKFIKINSWTDFFFNRIMESNNKVDSLKNKQFMQQSLGTVVSYASSHTIILSVFIFVI
jgi:hypothetical protein